VVSSKYRSLALDAAEDEKEGRRIIGHVLKDEMEEDHTSASETGDDGCDDYDDSNEGWDYEIVPFSVKDRNQEAVASTSTNDNNNSADSLKKDKLVCEVCLPVKKRFYSVATLCQHLHQSHSDLPKTFFCNFPSCDDGFGTSIQFEEHFRNHLRDTFKGAKLGCRFCPRTFLSTKRKQEHEEEHHKDSKRKGGKFSSSSKKGKFVCNTCGKLYPSSSSLRHHERAGHGRLVYCEICPPERNYRSHDRLLIHILKEHENDPTRKILECPKCPKRFATKFMMKRHFEGHLIETEKPLFCEICEKRFASTEGETLSEHIASHSKGYEKPPKRFKCSKCPREFGSPKSTALYRHERKYHPELLIHGCHLCDRRYSIKEFLETHLKIHDPKGPYVCLVCCSRYGSRLIEGGYPFDNGELLDAHLKKHTGENCKVCEECGEKFDNKNTLLHHMSKVHGAERKFACDVCDKRYPTSNDLSAHVRSTHDLIGKPREPRPCPECDQVFYSRSSIKNHIRRVHRQAERKVCEQCGKTLRSGVALRDHMNMHEGIKNFACGWCEKRFVRKDELTLHTYTHTGEKPHKCYICGRGFTQRHSMKTHIKTHEKNGTWIPPPDGAKI
jgi:KRAB domain-containing zinc finger protein